MPTAKSFKTTSDITRLVEQFEGGILPKAQWTHQAHVVVCLWYLLHHSPVDALRRLRQGILNYNESVGTPNTDASGYHETITRCYVMVILGFMIRQRVGRWCFQTISGSGLFWFQSFLYDVPKIRLNPSPPRLHGQQPLSRIKLE